MRSSSELTPQHFCGKNKGVNATRRNDFFSRAAAVKEVWNMVLAGDLPNDVSEIRDELLSTFDMHDVHWEQQYQKQGTAELYAEAIVQYKNWEHRELEFPEQSDMTDPRSPLMFRDKDGNLEDNVVTYFDGQPMRAVCDYVTKNGHTVTFVREHTGREKKDVAEQSEIWPLILLGRKLYPGYQIKVEENYLRDRDSKTEKFAKEHFLPYEPSDVQLVELHKRLSTYPRKTHTITDSREVELFFKEQYETESQGEVLDGENCSGCPKYNICHYTQPPIPREDEAHIRPFSEIQLNDSQQAVVRNNSGISRVNAGAGAGKTMTVAMRNVALLQSGVEPKNILNITFTNAGADEMRERIKRYAVFSGITEDLSDLRCQTFNSFCQDIINDYYADLGYTAPPRPVPEEIRADIINEIIGKYPKITFWAGLYDRFSVPNKAFHVSTIREKVSQIFTQIKEGDENGPYTRDRNPWLDPSDFRNPNKFTSADLDNLFLMYDEYNNTLKARNLLEFADQLGEVKKLLEIHPRLFDDIGFEHIMVDEFQDTDLPQVKLLQEMKDSSKFKSLMCIGDDSQAIFGFRHTSPEFMVNFGKYLGSGNEAVGYQFEDYTIAENYRSTGNIINTANKIIDLSRDHLDKTLVATREDGDPVRVNGYYTEKEEYEALAQKIKDLVDHGTDPADISFLAFTGAQLQKMADALTKVGVPSILMNPIPYTQNSNCAALGTFFDSYLYKTTQGVMDYLNARSKGGLMDASMEEIDDQVKHFVDTELMNGDINVSRFVELCERLDPDGKDECFQDFLDSRVRPCKSMDELKDLFDAVKNYGNTATFKREKKYDGVALCTIHSAKGREWNHVFYSLDKFDRESYHHGARPTSKEEAYRLWFVAASRARDTCECAGTYTIKANQRDGKYIMNDFLKEAYQVADRPYGFNEMSLWTTIAREKEEAAEAAQGAHQTGHPQARTAERTYEAAPSDPHWSIPAGRRPVSHYEHRTDEERQELMNNLSFDGQMSFSDFSGQRDYSDTEETFHGHL